MISWNLYLQQSKSSTAIECSVWYDINLIVAKVEGAQRGQVTEWIVMKKMKGITGQSSEIQIKIKLYFYVEMAYIFHLSKA